MGMHCKQLQKRAEKDKSIQLETVPCNIAKINFVASTKMAPNGTKNTTMTVPVD